MTDAFGSYDFRSPNRVTVGAVGQPGQRVFYLQARQGQQLVSLKLEKQQVAFLTGGLRDVLADLAAPSEMPVEAEMDLEEPIEELWAVASLELAYDSAADRIVLVAAEVGTDEEEEEEEEDEDGDEGATPALEGEAAEALGVFVASTEGAVARLVITREQAAGIIEAGKRLLRAGRRPCPLCGFPLTDDHSCPKTNGHKAPSL